MNSSGILVENNWEDKKLRNEYLDDWIGDLEGETNKLAFYELEEDATQCSNVASGVNGKIDSFPIHPKNKKKNESYIPNTFNTPCPKCGSSKFVEIDDEELEDGTQCYHLTCQDCGYTQRDEYNLLEEGVETSEEVNLDKFDDREELLNYLNNNTDYTWDVNEIYDDCVVYEDEDIGDIEVFVETEDNKKVYTVVGDYNVDKYNSLPEMLDGVKTLIANK